MTTFLPMADTPTTAEVSPSKGTQEIVKEAKRLEESTLHSAKGHFSASETWSRVHLWIGLPNAVAAGVAGTLALSFTEDPEVRILGGSLSILAAGLAAVQTFLNPNEKAAAHLNAGNSYEGLNARVRIFWTVECWEGQSDRALTEKLKDFAAEKEKLNRSCPQVPSWAYRRARRGIEAGEGAYSIDKPLPPGTVSPKMTDESSATHNVAET